LTSIVDGYFLNLWIDVFTDPMLIQVVIQTLENIKNNVPIVMDFIQFGGMDVMEKVKKIHSGHEFLAMAIPKLLARISGITFVFNV
jgi:hypothetical protein